MKKVTIVQKNTWIAAIPASNFPAGIQRGKHFPLL